jgi:hypothetical protein
MMDREKPHKRELKTERKNALSIQNTGITTSAAEDRSERPAIDKKRTSIIPCDASPENKETLAPLLATTRPPPLPRSHALTFSCT